MKCFIIDCHKERKKESPSPRSIPTLQGKTRVANPSITLVGGTHKCSVFFFFGHKSEPSSPFYIMLS